MTPDQKSGILKLDPDGCLSWHYYRKGWHRRVLFRINADHALYKCPADKKETEIGKVIRVDEGIVIAIFFL